MLRPWGFATFSLAALLLCGCASRSAWDKSDETSIRGLLAEYHSDWNHHDMQAMGNLFADDAQWINVVGMHWSGKADIMKAHEVYHRLLFPKTEINFTNIAVRPIAPNVAVAVVEENFDASQLPNGGIRPASKDILSFTFVKRDGQWKIVQGHNTIVLPEAQPYDPVSNGWNGGPPAQRTQ
jgi:uncharacterized protein (TIGR02246 family)